MNFLTKKQKDYNIFLQNRIKKFDDLWEEFNFSLKIEDSEEFKQVIFGLPIEALKDWKRNKNEQRTKEKAGRDGS